MICDNFVPWVFKSKKYHLLSLILPRLVREWRKEPVGRLKLLAHKTWLRKISCPHSTSSWVHKAPVTLCWCPSVIRSFSLDTTLTLRCSIETLCQCRLCLKSLLLSYMPSWKWLRRLSNSWPVHHAIKIWRVSSFTTSWHEWDLENPQPHYLITCP